MSAQLQTASDSRGGKGIGRGSGRGSLRKPNPKPKPKRTRDTTAFTDSNLLEQSLYLLDSEFSVSYIELDRTF